MTSKDNILQVAEDIFYQKGFALTTIRDIADKAKMNNAVVNYYFGSKENLYLTILKKIENALNSICIKRDIPENDIVVKEFIINSLKEVCLQYKVFHIYLKEQSQYSSVATENLVRKFQYKHFEYFRLLIQLQFSHNISNQKSELMYYSIFGMVKELLRNHKIKVNDGSKNSNLLDIEMVISYIDHNYLIPNFGSTVK